ncbi:MAG: iron chelate uptake ABC transporter family permease subunit, partial [Odoribacter sp.]|nr:iron chelate uptake ABC transporter family permease subunit [Odoribacter sp.]
MNDEVLIQYKRYRARNKRFIIFILLLLVLIGGIALLAGSHWIGGKEILALLRGDGTALEYQILLNIRLPRVLAAVITGIILSASGAIM